MQSQTFRDARRFFDAISTAKKHRKKGYMGRLLKKAMKFSYCNQKGLVYLVPAINGLYEKFGFEPYMGPKPANWSAEADFEADAIKGWGIIREMQAKLKK